VVGGIIKGSVGTIAFTAITLNSKSCGGTEAKRNSKPAFLGSDAENKTTPNGKTVTLSLATKTSCLKDNERQERTEWDRMECWGRLAEYAAAFRK
jgi:Single-strand binding protein family